MVPVQTIIPVPPTVTNFCKVASPHCVHLYHNICAKDGMKTVKSSSAINVDWIFEDQRRGN